MNAWRPHSGASFFRHAAESLVRTTERGTGRLMHPIIDHCRSSLQHACCLRLASRLHSPPEAREMKEIAWKKLSLEGFRKFGTWSCMVSPSGPHLGAEPIEFYGDMVQSTLGAVPVASFGVCRVVKRPFVIDVSEFHDTCCEIVLPLDGDVLMHVAPGRPIPGVSLRRRRGVPCASGHSCLPQARCMAPRPLRLRQQRGQLPDRPARTHVQE